MACGLRQAAFSRPPYLDPDGRQRVVDAARNFELAKRKDLTPVISAGGPPPCSPPLGPLREPRPECPLVAVAESGEVPDNYKDCKCEVKGECKKTDISGKKVRFSDEVYSEAAPTSHCVSVSVPAAAPRGPCDRDPDDPHDGAHDGAHDCTEHRERSIDRTAVTKHGPCDCPCWGAYSPSPPDTLATGDIYRTCKLPKRFQYPAWFTGYNTGPKHPLYRTTSSDIGRFPPTVHTVNTIYRPIDRSMSNVYVPAGPWRNRSLCSTGSIWEVYRYNNFY